MSRVLHVFGSQLLSLHECDLCQTLATRVLTDSYTGKDICFDCASTPADHGLFWTVTQDPQEDGADNLMEVAKGHGLTVDEEEEVPR